MIWCRNDCDVIDNLRKILADFSRRNQQPLFKSREQKEAAMRRLLFAIIAISAAALLAMTTPPAFARGGGHGGGGHGGGGHSAFAMAPSGDHSRHWSRHHRHERRWSRHHRHKHHRWSGDDCRGKPPGWCRGNAWWKHDGNKPPGLSGNTSDHPGNHDWSDERSTSDTLSGAASDALSGAASDAISGVMDRFGR